MDTNMDILKLLSRSTKPTNKSGAAKDASAKLPSAGTSVNPQLYHDAIPDSRGKKRKRGGEKVEEQTVNEEDESVDFFAPKKTAPKAKKAAPAENAKSRTKSISWIRMNADRFSNLID